jgi:ribosome-associated toxin RatA of RatAB toxin-antitoxin module
MAEHHASVIVDAPVHQVYQLFTHFNDFPKFMSFVKEVTYYDDQTSHWVVDVAGRYEWDATNMDWLDDRQIGWVSISGLKNSGKVTFNATGSNQTAVDVYIDYDPPAGVLGNIGENLGVGGRFDAALQHDLDNFAEMVRQAPPGALDPNSSSYLFHPDSAAAKGTTTRRQNEMMAQETTGREGTEDYRPVLDRDIIGDSTPVEPSGGVPPTVPEEEPGKSSDIAGLPEPTERNPPHSI